MMVDRGALTRNGPLVWPYMQGRERQPDRQTETDRLSVREWGIKKTAIATDIEVFVSHIDLTVLTLLDLFFPLGISFTNGVHSLDTCHFFVNVGGKFIEGIDHLTTNTVLRSSSNRNSTAFAHFLSFDSHITRCYFKITLSLYSHLLSILF